MSDEKDTSEVHLPLSHNAIGAREQVLAAPVAEQNFSQPETSRLEWLKLSLGALLTVAIIFHEYRDPISLFMVSGLVTALALYVSQKMNPLWGSALLASAAAGVVFFGGAMSGLVIASALALAAIYPLFQSRLQKEDDHFYLVPLCFWTFILIGIGILWMFNSADTRQMFSQISQYWNQQMTQAQSVLLGNLEMKATTGSQEEARRWMTANQTPLVVTFMLICQTIVSYLSIKWVRGRLRWSDPVWSQFVLFRIKPAYVLILIAGLLLLVLAPSIGGTKPTALAMPLIGWFASGCILAGLAYSNFMLMALRLMGRVTAARIYLFGTILTVLMASWLFLLAACLTGLIDIWFDMRKLAFTKSLLLGKGDS